MKTVHAVIIALGITISALAIVAVPSSPGASVAAQAPQATFQISAAAHQAAFVLNTVTGAVALCTGPTGASPAACSKIGKAE